MSTQTEIKLAKQAGWEYADGDGGFEPLWRFAALVRADERAKLAEQPAPAAQQEPLTDEQLRAMCKQTWVFETVRQWSRVIEAAHGITKGNT